MTVGSALADAANAGEREPRAPAKDSALSADRPFPGLRPFTFADRAFFFGRESQAFALYRLVDGGQFIAVVGGSGSGKSSLVLAGLCDLLDQETQDSYGHSWLWRDMRPGASPIRRFAETLARISATEDADVSRLRDRIEARLRQSSFSMQSALDEAGGLKGRRLLLIVDQFEELFRFGLAGLGQRGAGVAEARARDEATLLVQILLDSRRVPDVRILITMRSDFIGDCAYFAGLPEAVSATQYLVPGLTRLQLEEVIRRPVDEAGGSIEPELIERLLNDCSEELDQLPVLQHCLMRMWDRAGKTAVDGRRRLTRQTYDDIGRMTEALSQHADEILRLCSDRETAVEQAFRALSELDREGRAIRRPLRFDKLLAETGVAETDLRGVLDRFREPNCSFLVPPQSAAPILAPDDRVDIGHEALLRRWKKLAGESEKVEAATGRPSDGWLAKEQLDGQRYRTLASLLDGGSGEMATLNDPERVKAWWGALPRSPAWADRYGGKFEGVRNLIDRNLTAKRARRRRRAYMRAAAIVLPLVLLGAGALTLRHMKALEEEVRLREQAKAASQFVHDFLDVYHRGELSERGAASLIPLVDHFSAQVGTVLTPPEAGELWIETLDLDAELSMNSAEPDDAPRMASEARQTAVHFAERYPESADALQLRFDSLVQYGDAFLAQPNAKGNVELSFPAYQEALAVAERLETLGGKPEARRDIVKAHLRLGDSYRKQSPPAAAAALEQYAAALTLSQATAGDYRGDNRRDEAAANYRIGLALADLGSADEAESWLTGAKQIQRGLVNNAPDDKGYKWDLADTYMALGRLKANKNALKDAYEQYQNAVSLRMAAIHDPGSLWRAKLIAHDYDDVIRVLDHLKLSRDDETWVYFRGQIENLKELAGNEPNNEEWKAQLGLAIKRRGDRAEIDKFKVKSYAEALQDWRPLAANPAGSPLLRDRYKDLMDIGDALSHAVPPQLRDAADAYRAAAKVARLNLAGEPSNADWHAKADQAETDAEVAKALETEAPPTAN